MVRELDEQERQIVQELVKNPRISDNQIAITTSIPIKTVNRKRKKLETDGLLNYFTYLDNGTSGTGSFGSRQMFIVKFKSGISRRQFLDKFSSFNFTDLDIKHTLMSAVGEVDGHLALIVFVESREEADLLEILNAEIIPKMRTHFGEDAVIGTQSISVNSLLALLHNYMPSVNMHHGYIKKDWPDRLIFTD